MAGRVESVSDLYLRLGLDYHELQSNFIEAQSTIQTNMGRLSRENTIIRLQAEVEMSGLDETADAMQILTIRQNALNRQIENQRDRVNMATAQLRNMADAHGENSTQARRAQLALERERLALARLEEELQNVNDAQAEASSGTGNFLDDLQGIAGKVAVATAGLTAFVGALKSVSDASVELIEKFRELQTQSYELNMPVNDTKNFIRHMRLAGGDIGDFEGFIRGISDAMVKGEYDDPEAIVFQRYNESAFDANGHIKNFNDMTEAIKRMYDQAKAAGEEIEFLQLLGGESGVRDAIQYLERYAEAKEDADKIFDAGLEPAELHESERALNLLSEQVDEFKDALSNIATPTAQAAMKELFEVFHSGTEYIVENTEKFRRWGAIASEIIKSVRSSVENISEKMPDIDLPDIGVVKGPLEGLTDIISKTETWQNIVAKADKSLADYNQTIEESKTKNEELREKVEQLGDDFSQYGIQRVQQFKDALEDLNIELDFGDSEYDKSIAELELWRQRELTDKLKVGLDERLAIEELYAARVCLQTISTKTIRNENKRNSRK